MTGSAFPQEEEIDRILQLVDLVWMAFGCRVQPPS